MTKAKISEYDAVASNNTDVNGVNIAEGCPPSGMNNMGREIMAALKRFQVGSDGDGVTVGGNLVVSGSSTVNTFTAGPVSATTLNTSGAVVFNDAGADVDFRVEGDTEANLLFVDASTNRVGIGTDSPREEFDVNGDIFIGSQTDATNKVNILVASQYASGTETEGWQALTLTSNSTENNLIIGGGNSGRNAANFIRFYTAADNTTRTGTERMRITSAGELLVGGTTALYDISGMLSIQRTDAAAYLNLYRNDTSITTGNQFGFINFFGNDTTSNTPTVHAQIYAVASATHSAGSNGTDLVFGVTSSGTETPFEALRIVRNGTLESQDTYDNTQTGSTVVVTSGGLIGRTSSSIKYKKDVETLDADLVTNAITNLRPVWYRTKDAKGDDKETWSHIGLIAEEVHEVEPRLVRYRTEKVEFVDVEEEVTKTREVSPAVTDEEGNVVQEAVTEEYTETVTRKEKQKTPLETPEPEDVDYGRLAVLCLAKIQEQDKTIAALEARIAALENA